MKDLFKIVYWIFIIESSLLLIGIWTGLVSYGREFGTIFMSYGIILGIACSLIVKFSIRKFETPSQKAVAGFFMGIMLFLCFYYVLEDQFSLTFI